MDKLLKLTPWVPLLIAAGYFAFLIMTYVKVVAQLRIHAVTTEVNHDGHIPSNEG